MTNSTNNQDMKISSKITPKISRLTMMSVLTDANVRTLFHMNKKQMWKSIEQRIPTLSWHRLFSYRYKSSRTQARLRP